jgi:hypothetical protein
MKYPTVYKIQPFFLFQKEKTSFLKDLEETGEIPSYNKIFFNIG